MAVSLFVENANSPATGSLTLVPFIAFEIHNHLFWPTFLMNERRGTLVALGHTTLSVLVPWVVADALAPWQGSTGGG
jgi:hypothetical protein